MRLGEEGEVPSSEKLTRELPLASAIASLYDATVQVGEHASDGAEEISDLCIGLANALVAVLSSIVFLGGELNVQI